MFYCEGIQMFRNGGINWHCACETNHVWIESMKQIPTAFDIGHDRFSFSFLDFLCPITRLLAVSAAFFRCLRFKNDVVNDRL